MEHIIDRPLSAAQLQLAQLAAQFAATAIAKADTPPKDAYERASYFNDAITSAGELLNIVVFRTTPRSDKPPVKLSDYADTSKSQTANMLEQEF